MSELRDRDREPGYRGTTGRLTETYRDRRLIDPKQRARHSRQILSGAVFALPPAPARRIRPQMRCLPSRN